MDADGRHVGRRVARGVCERLAAMGEEILGDGWPDDEQGRVEGMRHLATQVACWFTYATGYSDPERPGVLPQRRPHVRVGRTERRPGRRAAPPSTVPAPTACRDAWARARSSSSRSRAARRRAAAPRSPPRCRRRRSGSGPATRSRSASAARSSRAPGCRSVPGPGSCTCATTTSTGSPAEPATFVIERLDTAGHVGARGRPRQRVAADARDRGARGRALERLLPRPAGAHARRADAQPVRRARRVGPRRAGHHLQPRLRVARATTRRWCSSSTRRPPRCGASARTRRAWYEPLDYATRVTSRNHRQVVADDDGLVRVVLAGADTGTANWLDTAGRPDLLTTVRWFRPPEPPPIRSEIVPLAALDDAPARRPSARRSRRARRRAPRSRRARVVEVPDVSDPNAVDGQVVIVTGGSKGVGRGIALAPRAAGRVGGDHRPSAGGARRGVGRARRARRAAPRHHAQRRRPRRRVRAGRADRRRSSARSTRLVANAQTFRSVTPFAEITEHDMDVLLNTGPKGTLWGMQAVFPHMRDQGRGRIVTMGSNAALLGAVGYAPVRVVEGGDPRARPARRRASGASSASP